MLLCCAYSFAGVALPALLPDDGGATPMSSGQLTTLHNPAKARNVIFLYMDGGPSQVDTFDYKPLLDKYNGRDPHSVFKVEPTQFNNVGKVMQSPWKFAQHGQAGHWVSELLPHLAG